ncbi:MAG: flavodoxin-dependent (E)-4-hydroxy-3-methylbut-2-enyl-diphosphate synthase, partial [Victivallaceae bacterium]|nr:flavodoxin-dependent (E)-4-hydroxy-3-methylbut-2-enyl-diphosphate synthase [Victivallaceae bacterium]
MEKRRLSRQIKIGSVAVGGGAPVSVQSMTNTDTRDVRATLAQIGIPGFAGTVDDAAHYCDFLQFYFLAGS